MKIMKQDEILAALIRVKVYAIKTAKESGFDELIDLMTSTGELYIRAATGELEI